MNAKLSSLSHSDGEAAQRLRYNGGLFPHGPGSIDTQRQTVIPGRPQDEPGTQEAASNVNCINGATVALASGFFAPLSPGMTIGEVGRLNVGWLSLHGEKIEKAASFRKRP
ncbi:hypothetical protein [Brevundimonas sp.]|uniref:hypothetical protein n=1 Tax=Brevundimonas sp. TaxID=1871086 RepID=UPI0025C5A454|nr:hypothetical protein [Brevundimonas sp.]